MALPLAGRAHASLTMNRQNPLAALARLEQCGWTMSSRAVDKRELPLAAVDTGQVAADRLGLGEPVLVRVGTSAVFRCGGTALRAEGPGADAATAVLVPRFLAASGIQLPTALVGPLRRRGQAGDHLAVGRGLLCRGRWGGALSHRRAGFMRSTRLPSAE